MKDIITSGVDATAFLRRAQTDGYSMQAPLVDPTVCEQVSSELRDHGLLRPMVELQPTDMLGVSGMHVASLLHQKINNMICRVEGKNKAYLPYYSVRVFEPGKYGTTVHRNHPCVGPWAVGITLNGQAPFNVYSADQLPPSEEVIELLGDELDPVPLATMETTAGSGWTLYTKDQLVPHSSGIVNSDTQRELILFYDTANDY